MIAIRAGSDARHAAQCLAQSGEPAANDPVDALRAAVDQFETVCDQREGLAPFVGGMANGGAHFGQGKRGNLGVPLPASERADRADWHFDHPGVENRVTRVRAKADLARFG